MKIEIKNRYTGDVIFHNESENNCIKLTIEKAVNLKAYLREAYLTGADLTGADLSGADLRWADLRGADLRGADLTGADLSGADLRGADLRWADLRWADLRVADLSEAYLRWADLRGADLSEADLREAYLTGADLSEADLRWADLRVADLRWADLTGAIGNGIQIITIQTKKYHINITKDIIQIGCKNYNHEEWMNFDDETITQMDNGALDWWKLHKGFIFKAIELNFGYKMNIDRLQRVYDSLSDESLEPTELDKRKEAIQVLADQIEKELLADEEQILFVMRNYLHQAVTEGIPEEMVECFEIMVKSTFDMPYENRYHPFKRFVDAAYRREAEQQAIKEIDENEQTNSVL